MPVAKTKILLHLAQEEAKTRRIKKKNSWKNMTTSSSLSPVKNPRQRNDKNLSSIFSGYAAIANHPKALRLSIKSAQLARREFIVVLIVRNKTGLRGIKNYAKLSKSNRDV